MRYKIAENVHILGHFDSGDTVTIELYNLLDDSSEVLTDDACTEIGSTGIFKWSTENMETKPTELGDYLWIMSSATTKKYGKIVLGGYVENIDSPVSEAGMSEASLHSGLESFDGKSGYKNTEEEMQNATINLPQEEKDKFKGSGGGILQGSVKVKAELNEEELNKVSKKFSSEMSKKTLKIDDTKIIKKLDVVEKKTEKADNSKDIQKVEDKVDKVDENITENFSEFGSSKDEILSSLEATRDKLESKAKLFNVSQTNEIRKVRDLLMAEDPHKVELSEKITAIQEKVEAMAMSDEERLINEIMNFDSGLFSQLSVEEQQNLINILKQYESEI